MAKLVDRQIVIHYPGGMNQPGELSDVVHQVARDLASGRNEDASHAMASIAFEKSIAFERKSPTPRELAEIYHRDRYLCRYCGTKTVLTPAMRLISREFPKQFPFHSNWKTNETHPAYWSLSATHDHVVPVSRGGESLGQSNLVTACWPCNSRKSGLLLGDIGFELRDVPAESTWGGLADLYRPLWMAAERPKLSDLDRRWLNAVTALHA